MATSARGSNRSRTSGPTANNTNSGLCVTGSSCRFGSSREVIAAADSRLIKIQVDGEEVSVDRYDVRLLLGDVAAFARQNCSEERRLAKLQENREIEDMRYEDLPRRAAFLDDVSPQQQQQQQQWTPTLEQQQKEHRTNKGSVGAVGPRVAVQTLERAETEFGAVPPPDALDQSEATSAARAAGLTGSDWWLSEEARLCGGASATPARRFTSLQREGAAAAAEDTASEEAPRDHEAFKVAAEGISRSVAEIEQSFEQQEQQWKRKDGECFVPPLPELPKDVRLPENLREYLVVERTAHFVREEGDRMEFRLLLDEERRLPFLAASHRLNPFYCWLKKKGYSLITYAKELLPPRICALLQFAYSLKPAIEPQSQSHVTTQQPTTTEETETTAKGKDHRGEMQQKEEQKQDLGGGLGLLLSYGSDEEDEEAPEKQQSPTGGDRQVKQEPSESQRKQLQHEQRPGQQEEPEGRQHEEHERRKQNTEQQQQQHQQGTPQADQTPTCLPKKRPPPPPPLPLAAEAEKKSDEEEDASASEDEESSADFKDLTTIWRCKSLTRFSLKKRQKCSSQKEEAKDKEDVSENIDAQLAALPKPPWALPNAKLGLSKASCLAIQQIGHLLLCAGDLALVQHAKTYQDDASSFPFLWSSSMDFRYFRYVLKCIEAEMQKEGFVKPKPLATPTHDMARSFLARLKLDHHLQQRKEQLLQQCERLSETASGEPSLDYLRTVETAAAAAAAAAANSSSNSSNSAVSSTAAAEAAESTQDTEAVKADGPVLDPASPAHVAPAESQLSPEAAAHLQMLLQQMAAASADNDAATYMACYSAYYYAVAALSPEAAAAAPAPAAAPLDT